MHFDLIIGNPPYCKNLHLKILEKVVAYAEQVVFLAPGNWAVNPYADIENSSIENRLRNLVISKVQNLEVIENKDVNTFFKGIYIGTDLIIIHLSNTLHQKIDLNTFLDQTSLFRKIWEKSYKTPGFRKHFITKQLDENFVLVRRTDNDYQTWCEKDNNFNAKEGILFASASEAQNFRDSILNTWVYKYIQLQKICKNRNNSAHMPFMGDYTQEWTNERFYKFFQLTDNEIKEIEEKINEL